ncbi:hypothetical protein SSPO_089930 [Streptomyces antimycoticus]|uniref:Uncharacterized protein n=1 Tax=Streptomyces antimycoticus TaxID=68175 RepID=A0A499UVS2_9ACTN|nr:hypothetical protein SSPO_089930 [Streptomyces antimycoticus]
MDPAVEEVPGLGTVSDRPLGGAGRIDLEDSGSRLHGPALRCGGCVDDPLAHAEDGGFGRNPAHGGPVRCQWLVRRLGLLAAQHGFQQFDGDDVGEPGDGHVHQLLGGGRQLQGGADPHPGVGQQLQPLAGLLGPAGQHPQRGGVPQRHHASGGIARTVRGAHIDHQ